MHGREPKSPTLEIVVREGSTADKRLKELIASIGGLTNGGSNEVLTAIGNLTNLVKEKFMGLKEDNDALTERMGQVESAVELVAADVSALKDELKAANERSNIDLTPLIARAEGIAARLTGIAGQNAGSDPEAPPEPPAEPTA